MTHVEAADNSGNVAETLKAQLVGLKTDFADIVAKRADESDAKIRSELDGAIQGISARIDSLETLNKASEAYETPGIVLSTPDKPNDGFSYTRALRGLALVKSGQDPRAFESKELGYEGEYFKEMRSKLVSGKIKRTYNAATDPSGAFLVGTDLQPGIIDLMREHSTAYAAGARRMDGATSNLAWLRNTGGTTAYWFDSEAEVAITESKSSFTQITAKPHPVGVLCKMSWGMLNQPTASVEPFVRGEMAEMTALAENAVIYNGSGAAGKPRGILQSGISTLAIQGADYFGNASYDAINVGTAAGSIAIQKGFRGFMQTLRANKALGRPGAKLAFIAEDDVMTDIETAVDGHGRPLYLNDDQDLADRLYRHPLINEQGADFSGGAADRTLLAGDFNQVVIPHWGAMEFEITNAADGDFERGRISVRVITAMDVAVLQPTAFVEATGYGD